MSWSSKIAWTEGLFLRPQHFQQADRYHEHLLEARVGRITPYPWGITALEIDHDLAQQGKFAVRRVAGVMPDGTPFDLPNHSPLPEPLPLDDKLANAVIGLAMPAIAPNTREVDFRQSDSASRYIRDTEFLIDSTSSLRQEEELEVAHPRLNFRILQKGRTGFISIGLARVVEIQDNTIVFDEEYIPPAMATHAHPQLTGLLDRVIGWIESRLEELGRYAADPSAGGGLQSADYFILQCLNRHITVFRHFRSSQYVHPERLYETMIGFAGELATYTTSGRMATNYAEQFPYNQDDLEGTFRPVRTDIQMALAARTETRAVRLELIEKATNVFVSTIRDRALFQHATFIIEVAASKSLTEIQQTFPQLFKMGPNTKMHEIVNMHLPGVPLVHLPTPPRQIRALTDHVYFRLDKQTPLWPEFSVAAAVGMHFSGNWPDLKLEFWAIREDRR